MKAELDKVVSIHYSLTDDDGVLIDNSRETGVLDFVQGKGYLLPKLEEALLNHEIGDVVKIDLEAKDAYGEYDENLKTKVARENFEFDQPIEIGMKFQAMTPFGPQIVTVCEVSEDSITVDANHELAGKRLHFEVEIMDIRDATEDELKAGRVGGGCGGCGGGCGGDCGGDCNCEGGCGCSN